MINARRLLQFINPFAPPYYALLLWVWIYFICCFVLHPESAIMSGRFIDPDNTMYLVHTLDWIHGQGWYDRVVHRMNPPEGVLLHFSRLMELPYALTLLALQPFMNSLDASIVTAAFWPPLFLFSLLIVVYKQALKFMSGLWASLTSLVILLSSNLTFAFMPGQIDHHGFIVLLIMLCLTQLLCLLDNSKRVNQAILLGCLMALALAIGLETLPWLLLLSAFIGVWSLIEGGAAADAALVYGATLSGAGTLFFMMYVAPNHWFDKNAVSYSIVYLVLLYIIASCYGIAWFVRKKYSYRFRSIVGSLFALAMGGVYLFSFPEIRLGPYGALDTGLAHFMLPNITEAVSLYDRLDQTSFLIWFLPLPLLSLLICIYNASRQSHSEVWVWVLYALMQATGLLLSGFYQSRYIPYAFLFSVIPATYAISLGIKHCNLALAHDHPWGVILMKKFALLSCIPLLTLGVSKSLYDMSWVDVLYFPMMEKNPECDLRKAASVLSHAPYFMGKPQLILNTIDEGPELLLRTPHSILSAPFHTNLSGNLDAETFFRSTNQAAALAILRERHVDYVLSCRDIEGGYLVNDKEPVNLKAPNISVSYPPPLVYQITTTEIPSWLKPIKPLDLHRIVLFKVMLAP